MGFSDFVKRAVSAVAGVEVDNSFILNALGPIAGMVTQAIPVVGPIISAGVSAMGAIFSNDSPAPSTSGAATKPELDRPVSINLKRTEEDIDKVLNDSITHLKINIKSKYQDLARISNESVEKMKEMFSHSTYLKERSSVESAVKYLKNNKQALDKITASSDESLFNAVFDNREGGGSLLSTRLSLWTTITELETLVVTRGLEASLHRANEQYGKYIDTLTTLRKHINQLRDDGKSIHEFLDGVDGLVKKLVKKRDDSITTTDFDDVQSALMIRDSWPHMAIGYVSPTMKDNLPFTLQIGVDTTTDPTKKEENIKNAKNDAKNNKCVKAYQDIANLAENLHQWNTRLPATPAKLEEGLWHVKPIRPVENASTSPLWKKEIRHMLEDVNFYGASSPSTSPLWGKNLRYMLTYVNTYGESPPSELSQPIVLKGGVKVEIVELSLNKIVFDDDPFAGLPAIKDNNDNEVPPDRGIRRRIYVRYASDSNPDTSIYDLVGEVGESATTFIHHLIQKPALPSGTPSHRTGGESVPVKSLPPASSG